MNLPKLKSISIEKEDLIDKDVLKRLQNIKL